MVMFCHGWLANSQNQGKTLAISFLEGGLLASLTQLRSSISNEFISTTWHSHLYRQRSHPFLILQPASHQSARSMITPNSQAHSHSLTSRIQNSNNIEDNQNDPIQKNSIQNHNQTIKPTKWINPKRNHVFLVLRQIIERAFISSVWLYSSRMNHLPVDSNSRKSYQQPDRQIKSMMFGHLWFSFILMGMCWSLFFVWVLCVSYLVWLC